MTRLSRAVNSRDLAQSSPEKPTCRDIDTLTATGWVGQRRPIGILLAECRQGCAGEGSGSVALILALQHEIEVWLRREARKAQIRILPRSTASLMVRELLLSACLTCNGLGFLPLDYTGERKEDLPCRDCGTTGKAVITVKYRSDAIGQPYKLISSVYGQWLHTLVEWESEAIGRINGRLR